MAENLRVTHYFNGDMIPQISDNVPSITFGAFAIYPSHPYAGIVSDEEMVAAYGLLYNWYATIDPKGLRPEGWGIPRDLD
ncbi:MAG TPA: hypothetical protein ENN08_05295 [Bacteroidales bacterium]|nr:hypothetical protein [Bacteroidales bacterium]